MRVVLAPDAIGRLSSAAAGRALADGWPGADLQLAALGEAGLGFGTATADLLGVAPRPIGSATLLDTPSQLVLTTRAGTRSESDPIELDGSSWSLGQLLRKAIEQSPYVAPQVVLELSGFTGHDGGAGLLAGLGARSASDLTAGVTGLDELADADLEPVRQLLAGRELVGIVGETERQRLLLGLRGITSLRGRASGMEPDVLLRTDAALQSLAEALQRSGGRAGDAGSNAGGADLGATPGAGAHGGLGLAVLALGGRLTTGPRFGIEATALDRRLIGADLLVTGCTRYDFAHRGGGVISELAALAAEALVPCVVLAGEVLIGAREMRTMGIEAAYPVHDADPTAPAAESVGAVELSALARRVGRSWTW